MRIAWGQRDQMAEKTKKRWFQKPGSARACKAGKAETPISIIVVDDHRFMRGLISAMLARQEGRYKVVAEKGDAATAIAACKELTPDLLILDINLPDGCGIEAVPHGQVEAAQSLGMSPRTTFRRIVVPQAFRIVTPAIGNDFVAMIKDSSLAYVVGVQDVLWRAQAAGRPTFQSMQTLLVAAFVYWVLTILFSLFQGRLERRMATGDRNQSKRP